MDITAGYVRSDIHERLEWKAKDLERVNEMLRERLKKLEADKERLDWLWMETGGTRNVEEDDRWMAMWSFPPVIGYRDSEGWPDDIREAIDAARKGVEIGPRQQVVWHTDEWEEQGGRPGLRHD